MKRSITIIIVNWNTKDMLVECIFSILRNTNKYHPKIIVVDNNSSDGSRDEIKRLFSEVKVVNSGRNLGFAKANNIGCRLTDSEFILFLNPDTLILNEAIDEMVNKIEANPEIGALGCRMHNLDGKVQELGIQWFPTPFREFLRMAFLTESTTIKFMRLLPYKNPKTCGYVKKLYGGCLMVRTIVLQKIGLFDERFFMYCEDVDLCERIKEAGYKLYYTSEEKIIHIGGGSSNKASSQFSVLMMNESILKLMEKYYGYYGKLAFKIYAFIAAMMRILIIGGIIMSKSLNNKKTIKNFNSSFDKYITILKWSLSLKKPIVP